METILLTTLLLENGLMHALVKFSSPSLE